MKQISSEPKLYITAQRKAVLDAVRECCSHVDAATVYELVKPKMPHISLGTIYRSLASLRDAGLIHEIDTGAGASLYDGNLSPHQHATCRSCGAVVDCKIDLPSSVLRNAAKASGFAAIEASRIDFHGLCATCARSASEAKNT